MHIRELEYIITVSEEKNFTRAAEKLFISQPSLSQSIKKIETHFNIKIFNRDKGVVTITTEGEIFIHYSKEIIQSINHMKSDFEKLVNAKTNTLDLGMPYHLGSLLMPGIISDFCKQYSDIKVSIHEATSSKLEEMIENEIIDIAILPLPLKNDKLEYTPFFKDEFVLIMSPSNHLNKYAYEHKDGKMYFNLLDAKDATFNLGIQGQRIRTINDIIFKKVGINPKVNLGSSNIETMKNIALSGMGITLLPKHYIDESKVNYYHLEKEQNFIWTASIVYNNFNNLSKSSLKLISMLKDNYSY